MIARIHGQTDTHPYMTARIHRQTILDTYTLTHTAPYTTARKYTYQSISWQLAVDDIEPVWFPPIDYAHVDRYTPIHNSMHIYRDRRTHINT